MEAESVEAQFGLLHKRRREMSESGESMRAQEKRINLEFGSEDRGKGMEKRVLGVELSANTDRQHNTATTFNVAAHRAGT